MIEVEFVDSTIVDFLIVFYLFFFTSTPEVIHANIIQ